MENEIKLSEPDFENFLQDLCEENNKGYSIDELCDIYVDWVTSLTSQEWIDLGNRFAKKCLRDL